MNKYLIILPICLILNHAFPQSRSFVSRIDSSYNPGNKYIEKYDWEIFFESGLAEAEMDLFHLDTQLMIATVFFTINKNRAEKSREPYKYAPELEEVAYNYVNIKSRRRLEDKRRNEVRLAKDFPEVGKLFGFSGKLQDFNIATINAIDYKRGKKFYFDRRDESTELKLFYGEKYGKNKTEEKIPVEYYTYEQFAEKLVKEYKIGFGSNNTRSKAFEYMGLYIEISDKTIHRRRIPKAKSMIVFGGFRLRNIETEEN